MATIKDRNVGWLRKLVYYPVNVAESVSTGSTASLTSLESATSKITRVGSTATMFGLLVTSTGDGVDFYRMIPYDLDPNKNIGITAIWTKDGAGVTQTTSLQWAVQYQILNIPQIGASAGGFGGTLTTPSTVLNTVIAAQKVTATDSMILYASPRGIITPTAVTSTNGWWALRCVLASVTPSAPSSANYLLGLVVDYNVRKTTGLQSATSAQLLQNYMDTSPSPSSTFTP